MEWTPSGAEYGNIVECGRTESTSAFDIIESPKDLSLALEPFSFLRHPIPFFLLISAILMWVLQTRLQKDDLDNMNQSQLDALLDGPALAPPPGIEPNLVNPPDKIVASYLVTCFSLAISTLAVLVRMYTRAFVVKQVNFPDCE